MPLDLELLWVCCMCVILITSAWTAPESDTGKSGLRLSWKGSTLEVDGMLQTTMVSPRIRLHLVADSRRQEWGAELMDDDTMAG